MKKPKRVRGQTWSVDLIIGVVVFMLVIVILYAILSTNRDEEHVLRQEADIIHARLDRSATGVAEGETPDPQGQQIIEGNKINRARVEEIYDMNYEDLKSALGVRGDFCVVIVNDDNRIVPVGNETFLLSAGNPKHGLTITKDGILCGRSSD